MNTQLRSKKKAAAGLLTCLIIGVVTALLYLNSVSGPVTMTAIEPKRVPTLVVGDGPGATTGLSYIMIYPHQAVPATAYASNLSTGNAYEYSLTGNESATGSTPFLTKFDIVVKAACDFDDGYNQTSETWDDDYLWMTITCTDLSISANSEMSMVSIVNTAATRWVHFVMNNGGTGYQIPLGFQYNITSLKYWVMAIET
jgi:hypothetical protein